VRAVGRFLLDFFVGDDWKVAASVVAALALGAVLVAAAASGAHWLAPVAGLVVAGAFVTGLAVDLRRR
jgi:hypothetical protein